MAKPNPFRSLTDQVSVPLEAVADAVGRSYQTVLAYRTGVREPPPEVYGKLADFIAEHRANLPAIEEEARRLSRGE